MNPVGVVVRPLSVDGTPDAFVDGLRGRLVGALTIDTGDRAVAEEIAQEALAKAVVHWRRVRGMDRPEAWVFRVAFNAARSAFRRRAAERRAYDRLIARDEGGRGPVSPGPEMSVPGRLALRQAVDALPPRQRQVIAARFYADLSVADTAAVMGCAEGTVKSLTSKALAGLRAAGAEEVALDA